MCYHTKQSKSVSQLEQRFDVTREKDRFNIKESDFLYHHANGYDHPELLIIPQEEPSLLHPAIWGLAPAKIKHDALKDYYRKAVKFGGGLNAQSEKVFDHFIYKYSIFEKRCLIPLDGFYEPHTAPNKLKIPFHFKRKDNDSFALAGIYNINVDGTVTMTILTKKASPLFGKIHNTKFRQPVLLNKIIEKEWLADNITENYIKELVNAEYPESELDSYPISRDLFSPRINSNRKNITEKFEYPELNIEIF
jgi:putative SOS response-associated peptidase YedK